MTINQNNKKNTKIGIFIFIALIIIFGAAHFLNVPKTTDLEKAYTLTVVDDMGMETQYESTTNAEYVGEALMELSKTQDFTIDGNDGEFGFFILSVNELVADYDVDGAYWAFYINDDYANFGIDQQPLTDGDKIQLSYEKGLQ